MDGGVSSAAKPVEPVAGAAKPVEPDGGAEVGDPIAGASGIVIGLVGSAAGLTGVDDAGWKAPGAAVKPGATVEAEGAVGAAVL